MSNMYVRFWGTRGSIPTPGRETEKYGGNTTCLEVRAGDTIIVFDAGSGIRVMGEAWKREFGDGAIEACLLFTHLHWDHIQGFPFFSPAYNERNAFSIYGEDRPTGDIREQLSGQMQGAYFPIPLSFMRADMKFLPTSPEFSLGPVKVCTFHLPHPGGCLGYRLEANGSVFVLATDCELDQALENPDEVRDDPDADRLFPADLVEAMSGADLIVIDAQYTDEQYRRCVGWGHNSLSTVVQFCTQIKPHMLGLCHHDPQSTDAQISTMVNDAAERLDAWGVRDTLVFGAREGLTLDVSRPLRPVVPL